MLQLSLDQLRSFLSSDITNIFLRSCVFFEDTQTTLITVKNTFRFHTIVTKELDTPCCNLGVLFLAVMGV